MATDDSLRGTRAVRTRWRTPRLLLGALLLAAASVRSLPSTTRRLADAAAAAEQPWWCSVDTQGRRCTGEQHDCAPSAACAWPDKSATVAIMLSDRLEQALNVTLHSACAHSPVTLIFISTTPQPHLPPTYRACSLLPLLARDVVANLETQGYHPLSVCTLNATSPLLHPPAAARLTASGRHVKHAMCLNHLRFYLAELPALRACERAILLDDDVVVSPIPLSA